MIGHTRKNYGGVAIGTRTLRCLFFKLPEVLPVEARTTDWKLGDRKHLRRRGEMRYVACNIQECFDGFRDAILSFRSEDKTPLAMCM